MEIPKYLRVLQEEFYDGCRRSQCLRLIYQLKINEILIENGGYLTTESICSKISGKKIICSYLERILLYLSAFGVFEEKSVGDVVMFKATDFLKLPYVTHFSYAFPLQSRYMELLEGKAEEKSFFEYVHGYSFWDRVGKEPAKSNFMDYMKIVTSDILPVLSKMMAEIRKEDCKKNAVIVDVGGSQGDMMRVFHENFPSMQCINFDLPSVINGVTPIEGVEMVSGDMFEVHTLPKCDIIFTKNILHDWSDEKCIQFLKNFYKVIADDGLLLSVNYHLEEPGCIGPYSWIPRSKDILMMELYLHGQERSKNKYKTLHEQAGFKLTRYVVLGPEVKPVALLVCEKIR